MQIRVNANAMEDYARAVARERAAWEAVRGRLPGSPQFNPELWSRWRVAVEDADHAAAQAKRATALSARRAAPPVPFSGRGRPEAVQIPSIARHSWAGWFKAS